MKSDLYLFFFFFKLLNLLNLSLLFETKISTFLEDRNLATLISKDQKKKITDGVKFFDPRKNEMQRSRIQNFCSSSVITAINFLSIIIQLV